MIAKAVPLSAKNIGASHRTILQTPQAIGTLGKSISSTAQKMGALGKLF
jgi:hypothetical protein